MIQSPGFVKSNYLAAAHGKEPNGDAAHFSGQSRGGPDLVERLGCLDDLWMDPLAELAARGERAGASTTGMDIRII
jgi:hypothetical protein